VSAASESIQNGAPDERAQRANQSSTASEAHPAADEGGRLMSMPFYVAPEQVMKDRADYARKGIARGRAAVAIRYVDGVALVAENQSNTLRKISEIYDRIAFAGVGKYNEFDQLRVAGVRAADLKGFQYSREDVDARSLANQYAQILGQVFTHEMKPMEVEILVAEVGITAEGDQLYHILYDGTVMDERQFTVLGGDAEAITGRLRESLGDGLDLAGSVRAAASALSGPDRTLSADDLEVALLERNGGRRCFRRATDEDVAGFLAA
jgi:proteasome alpha subunit